MSNISGLPTRPVKPGDKVCFHCTRCGDCCRHNKNAVMLESLDAFRLARFFRKNGRPEFDLDELYGQYTEFMPLDEYGFPIALLKTVGPDDACVFYKNGLCSVQDAKPHTCRLYPFSVGPGTSGDFSFYLCEERPHHLTGGTVRVGDWLRENFTEEDRNYQTLEWGFVAAIGRLMKHIRSEDQLRGIMPKLLYYRFWNFDLEEPYMPQFVHNNRALIEALQTLICQVYGGKQYDSDIERALH